MPAVDTPALPTTCLGLIGCGAMGSAMAQGLLRNLQCQSLIISSPTCDFASAPFSDDPRVSTTRDNQCALEQSDIILLAVPPERTEEVIQSTDRSKWKDKVLLSIVSGISLSSLIEMGVDDRCAIRLMPNTPVAIGEGVIGLCAAPRVTETIVEMVVALLSPLGRVVRLEERNFSTFAAVIGAGPAYVYLAMQAHTDAMINGGIDREIAEEVTIRVFTGTAKLCELKEGARFVPEDVAVHRMHDIVCEALEVARARAQYQLRNPDC